MDPNSDTPREPLLPAAGVPGRRDRPAHWSLPPSPVAARGAAHPQRHRGTPWYAWLIGGCLGMSVLLVLFCAGILGVVGGLAFRIANQQDVAETATQRLAVGGIPTVTITADAGSIRVVGGGAHEVRVTATKRLPGGPDARDQLARAGVDVRQSGDTIALSARTPPAVGSGPAPTVDLEVALPDQSNVTLRLGNGSGEVDNLSATVSAAVTHGRLTLNNVTLRGRSSLEAGDGDIQLSGSLAPGAAAEVHVASGSASVALPRDAPVRVSAATRHGHVNVSGLDATPQRADDGASLTGVTRPVSTLVAGGQPATLAIGVESGDISLQVG